MCKASRLWPIAAILAAVLTLGIGLFLGRWTSSSGKETGTQLRAVPGGPAVAHEIYGLNVPSDAATALDGPPGPRTSAREESVEVRIQGAVISPGLYTLQKGARVYDLILRANGLRANAVPDTINIAAYLEEDSTLTIPSTDDSAATADALNPTYYLRSGWADQPRIRRAQADGAIQPHATPPGMFSLGSVTQSQLESIPGIGPALAGRILEYRDRNNPVSVEELEQVPGIGTKRLEVLKEFLAAP